MNVASIVMRTRVLKALSILLLSVFISASSVAADESVMKLIPAKIAVPSTKFMDGAKQVDLTAYRGRYVLLNFWATWCAPCVREMPALDRLADATDKEKLIVIAISLDTGGAAEVSSFLSKLSLKHLKILYDPAKKAIRDFSIRGLPTTILISPEGSIVAKLEGEAAWDKPALLSQIAEFILVK